MALVPKPPVPPFELGSLAYRPTVRPTALGTRQNLETVTRRPRKTIDTPDEVPAGLITRVPVTNLMHRPRSLDVDHIYRDWTHQFSEFFILHLPGGFIGDNVVFDRDRYYSFGHWWLGNRWEVYRNTSRIRAEPGWVISIAAWGGEAFQHFVIDAVPRIAAVIDLLESPDYGHIRIATHQSKCAVARWLWGKLGIEDRIIQKPLNSNEGFVIQADVVLYPDFHPAQPVFGRYPRHTLVPLQHRLGLLQPGTRDLVVYLQRHGGKRRVANEDEVLDSLTGVLRNTPLSLEVFNNSGDFDTDASIMRRVAVVLGPHGGAFGNVAFAPPGTRVVEFVPIYDLTGDLKTMGRNYWGLSQAAGHHYWVLEPEEFDFDGPMYIDCGRLRRLLGTVLSQPGS